MDKVELEFFFFSFYFCTEVTNDISFSFEFQSAVGFEDMTNPNSSHSSIPKYEKPVIPSKP